ncbi:thiol:disulfide oxidoreductase [Tateyamaria omphalii]|nr:thiol:disulfide oxidoreductase [Tateyamaria omphalii]
MTLTVYADSTPNPYKVTILLESLGLDYDLVHLDFSKNEQKTPEFLKINPNGKVPVLVDDGFTVIESGAILMHLAEKHGRFLPKDVQKKSETLQWLMWQMAGLGPVFGQLLVFAVAFGNEMPRATKRYQAEVLRLLSVLNSGLEGKDWVAAGEHTNADMAIWPWVRMTERAQIPLVDMPNLKRWYERLGQMDAYITGVEILGDKPEETRMKGFFGATVGVGS